VQTPIYGILYRQPDIIIPEIIAAHLQTPEEAEEGWELLSWYLWKSVTW